MTEVQVSLETVAGLERRMRVQVPAGRIEQEVEARLRATGRTAALKGFRPGKVPAHVVRQRFGARIRQEVLREVVQSSFSEAIDREKLHPVGNPRIEADALTDGQDLSYTAVFEVYPEIRVTALDRLTIEKPETSISPADVERTVERLQRQKGTWKVVERKSAHGDRVTVDFDGTRKGEPIEGGKAEKVHIVIGDSRMLPEFEANLIGLAAGGNKTFQMNFPQDYHDVNLRGEQVSFDVRVHEVAEAELPPADADFITGYGVASGDPAEFRALILENLKREADSKIEAEIRRQVMEQLLVTNPLDLPSVLVTEEAKSLQAEGMRKLGIKDLKDAWPLNAYEDLARRRVHLRLIIGSIIRENNIQLDPMRVEQRLADLCRSYDQPDEVRKLYLQRPGVMAQIENAAMEDQVMAWLFGRAQIRTKSVAFTDLMSA